LRIEGTSRSSGPGARGGVGRTAGGASFSIESESATQHAAAAGPAAASSGIEALLALQAVEDPLLSRKKAVRRGNALLDTLEDIKADLLLGLVSEGRLNHLMALITQVRERNLPGLDHVIDDIELRARVELAKFGRLTGA